MDLKTFLSRFWQLANVVRIAGVQALSALCVGYAVGQVSMIYGARDCPPAAGFVNYFLWVFAIAGVSGTVVGLYYIFFPAIWLQKIDRQLLFSNSDLNVPFYSTRPEYLLIDAVMFIPGFAFVMGGTAENMCRFNFEWAFGWTFLAMASIFPLSRAISWHLLGRKITAKQVTAPWATLIIWLILTVPSAIAGTVYYMKNHVLPRLHAPVVDEQSFAGGLAANQQFTRGIVRVRGKLVRGISKCGISEKRARKKPYPAGTVLLDMGLENGQIMVKADSVEEVAWLETESAVRMDKSFEAYGRLSRLPNLKKKDVCGLDKVKTQQKGGLALLEAELPGQ